ncbi:4166_t:CDS:2, partial [Dentiscutata heterogama]
STTGTLRLTEDGSRYYNGLSSKTSFFEMLQKQLTDCIPISDTNRLSFISGQEKNIPREVRLLSLK